MMPGGPPPPDPDVRRWSRIVDAYRGLVAFGVLNVATIALTTVLPGAAIKVVVLLAATSALAVWMDRGLRRRAFAVGLLGGYALMTVISGGACTLFVPQPLLAEFNMVSGAFLYAGAIIIFGLVLLNHHLSESG